MDNNSNWLFETVTFSCGHTEKTYMPFKDRRRVSEIEFLQREGLCSKCLQKQNEEELLLPKLKGSENQIAWAEKIRRDVLADIRKNKKKFEAHLNNAENGQVPTKKGTYPSWAYDINADGLPNNQVIERTRLVLDTILELEKDVFKETSAKSIIEEMPRHIYPTTIVAYVNKREAFASKMEALNKATSKEDMWEYTRKRSEQMGLIKLKGSEEQVNVANEVRLDLLDCLQENKRILKRYIDRVQRDGFLKKNKTLPPWARELGIREHFSKVQALARIEAVMKTLREIEQSIRRRRSAKYFVGKRTSSVSLSTLSILTT